MAVLSGEAPGSSGACSRPLADVRGTQGLVVLARVRGCRRRPAQLLVPRAVVVAGRTSPGRRACLRHRSRARCATTAAGVHALADRCPHRGVPLSLGREEFPGTLTCAYHGWTYRLSDGELVAVITDGPDSPICGKVRVPQLPDRRVSRPGLGVHRRPPPAPADDAAPRGAGRRPAVRVGGRIEDRTGDWRLFAENGFDEGHAKYLHRHSLWRTFKMMPTWNQVHIERHGRWIYRIEDERHWDADFPGLGHWTNKRWWKMKPRQAQGRDARQHRRCDEERSVHQLPGLPRLRVAVRARRAAHRLPAVHPLRVLRADRRRTHALRRGHGAVQDWRRRARSSSPSTSVRSAGSSTGSSRPRTTGWCHRRARLPSASTDRTSR